MKHVLVIIERPLPGAGGEAQSWLLLQQDIATYTATAAGIERIAENVLLIVLEKGLHSLAQIVVNIELRGFAHRALIFDQSPEWIRG